MYPLTLGVFAAAAFGLVRISASFPFLAKWQKFSVLFASVTAGLISVSGNIVITRAALNHGRLLFEQSNQLIEAIATSCIDTKKGFTVATSGSDLDADDVQFRFYDPSLPQKLRSSLIVQRPSNEASVVVRFDSGRSSGSKRAFVEASEELRRPDCRREP